MTDAVAMRDAGDRHWTFDEVVSVLTLSDVRVTVMQGSEAARRLADTIRGSTLALAADAYDALARMIDSGDAQRRVLAEHWKTLAEARATRESRSQMVRDWAGRRGLDKLVGDMGRGVAATDAHIVWLKQQITVLEHTLTAMGIEEAA